MTRPVSGLVPQGIDESIVYKIDFTRVADTEGAAVSVSGCTLYNRKTSTYVTMSGSASLAGNVASSKTVAGLQDKTTYLLSIAVLFASGNVISATLPIRGEL